MKRSLLSLLRSQTAETLAEVIIALVVLAVGATGASTLIYVSISANAEGEQRIEAYNLAREGVEAVRNIRDTNWLRFPGNRTDCWDVTLETTDPTKCKEADGAVKIGSAAGINYVIYPQLNETDEGGNPATDLFSWKLEILIPDGTDAMIYEYPFGDDILYVNDPWHTLGETLTETPYERIIRIEKIDNTMIVTSTVSWQFKNRMKTVTFMDELTNY
ncbi:MAG: hypothetical protein WC882_04660 [Candidatus Gracilibacteria bacterium]